MVRITERSKYTFESLREQKIYKTKKLNLIFCQNASENLGKFSKMKILLPVFSFKLFLP